MRGSLKDWGHLKREKENVTVSYVIVNYRGKDMLPRCLHSVFDQRTDVPREIIVSDDASDDGSVEMLRGSFPQVSVVQSDCNRGVAAARNLGAKTAKGEFIAFLDNDVELHPDWTEAMLGCFNEEGPTVGICASHLLYVEPPGLINSTGGVVNLLGHAWDRDRMKENGSLRRRRGEVLFACGAAMMVRRSVLEELGWFDEKLRCAYDDVDLGWRAILNGYRVIYEPCAEVRHLANTTLGRGTPFNKYQYERNRFRLWIKCMETNTIRLLLREYLYLFSRQARWECREARSFREKLEMRVRMAQVVAWNLVHLPDTWRARRRVLVSRKVSDMELIMRGVIQPHIGFPPNVEVGSLKSGRLDESKGSCSARKMVMGKKGEESLREGWYDLEVHESGATFRWTGERARAVLKGNGRERELCITTRMGHPLKVSRALILVNGVNMTEVRVPNHEKRHRIPLPPDNHTALWEIEIRALDSFRPSDVQGTEDVRLLGVAVESMLLR